MEHSNKSKWDEVKRIDLVDYLDSLGFRPQKVSNHDFWYRSPLRDEKTPSFKVNRQQNVWFDHGTGEGGTIIDLGARLHNCCYREFVEKLSSGDSHLPLRSVQKTTGELPPPPKLEIVSTSDLSDPGLIRYLGERGIDPGLARRYCREIEFRIGTKNYLAIGFANRSGGYELRNSWFKGSSSPKDISLISKAETKVCVFEGFIDFLSALKADNGEMQRRTHNADFLVLNSLRFINRSLPILQSYREVNLFLDNDLAARQTKDILRAKSIPYRDASALYGTHKDVNEYLTETIRSKQGQDIPRRRSRGMRL